MTITSPWVFIRFINQPLDIMFTIPHNRCRSSQCGTNELIVDDETAEVVTCYELFDNNTPAEGPGGFKGLNRLFPICNICCIAFTMISIDGLDHQRISELFHCIL